MDDSPSALRGERLPPYDRYAQRDERSIIGKPTPRLDAHAKVTGAATYTHDVRLPNMLFAMPLRSPHASALVTSVDASQAEALPGVMGILTFPGRRVRFAGDEVAAVAAESIQIARDAIELINVDYQVFPSVVTIEDAIAPGAPQVYDDRPNMGSPRVRTAGDIEEGFAEAAVIVEDVYRTQVQTHSPMETHAAVCQWLADDQLKVWISTQGVGAVASEYADYFGLPIENVQVICDYIGGGFGSKISAGTYGIMAAELARLTGRPVKMIVDRKGEQESTGNRPDSIQTLKVGARADGTLCAIEARGYGTPGTGAGAGFAAPIRGLYACENYLTEEISVYTNCGPATTMRAPGDPQGVFSIEAAMDELAYALGLDPLTMRLANDEIKVRRRQFKEGADYFGWSQLRNPVPGSDPGPVKRGFGLASCDWTNGGFGGNEVQVTVTRAGDVHIQNGTQDIGTGTRTWMAMLVAEELGLPLDSVRISIGDSRLPKGSFAGGSTTTPSMAAPTREAGENARLAIAEVAARELSAPADSLIFADGQVWAPNGEAMTFNAACALLPEAVTVSGTRMDKAKWGSDTTTGVHFVEVEVDTRTGKVTVKRVLAIHDAGRILNPLTAESQIIGGVIGGMNYALFEERIMDKESGMMLNANLESYKIGGSRDMPIIEPILTDVSTGGTYVGALGLGEPPFIPTAAAIGNAVRHAIGVRITSLPITPDKVLAALAGAADGGRR